MPDGRPQRLYARTHVTSCVVPASPRSLRTHRWGTVELAISYHALRKLEMRQKQLIQGIQDDVDAGHPHKIEGQTATGTKQQPPGAQLPGPAEQEQRATPPSRADLASIFAGEKVQAARSFSQLGESKVVIADRANAHGDEICSDNASCASASSFVLAEQQDKLMQLYTLEKSISMYAAANVDTRMLDKMVGPVHGVAGPRV